jgi:hypothetical protein
MPATSEDVAVMHVSMNYRHGDGKAFHTFADLYKSCAELFETLAVNAGDLCRRLPMHRIVESIEQLCRTNT